MEMSGCRIFITLNHRSGCALKKYFSRISSLQNPQCRLTAELTFENVSCRSMSTLIAAKAPWNHVSRKLARHKQNSHNFCLSLSISLSLSFSLSLSLTYTHTHACTFSLSLSLSLSLSPLFSLSVSLSLSYAYTLFV